MIEHGIDTTKFMCNPRYRPVVFDFEVLRCETMVTMYDVFAQRWSFARTPFECGKLIRGYLIDPRTVFVGFNNKNYDNLIATACIDNWLQKDVYDLNEGIINMMPDTIHGVAYEDFQELRFKLPHVWKFAKRAWDVGFDMLPGPKMSGEGVKIPPMTLKMWAKYNGRAHRKSPIPFTYPLPLTNKEVELFRAYNKDDVVDTLCLICTSLIGEWNTRCGFADMLGPKKFGWHKTFTKLAADLFVKYPEKKANPADTSWQQKVVKKPACLKIETYTDILKYFSNSIGEVELRSYSTLICGVPHTFRLGGAHSVNECGVFKGEIWHIDVGSMYPSIMSRFGLVSPTMDAKAFEKVRVMRMKMKKSDWRRDVFKKALNCSYGGMLDKYGDLFAPANGRGVCFLGQLFIVDMLERIEPYITLIQTNTDGIYVMPNSPEDAVHARAAVKAFEKRTGLVMDIELYKEMYQRDVNNYIAISIDGHEKVKGSAFHSINHAKPTVGQMMNRCEIMNTPFDPDQYSISELSIVCTRDKNSRGFSVDGVETNAEVIDVVPVYPYQSSEIYTVKHTGGLCKARLCPQYAALASMVDRSEIDFSYYQRETS